MNRPIYPQVDEGMRNERDRQIGEASRMGAQRQQAMNQGQQQGRVMEQQDIVRRQQQEQAMMQEQANQQAGQQQAYQAGQQQQRQSMNDRVNDMFAQQMAQQAGGPTADSLGISPETMNAYQQQQQQVSPEQEVQEFMRIAQDSNISDEEKQQSFAMLSQAAQQMLQG